MTIPTYRMLYLPAMLLVAASALPAQGLIAGRALLSASTRPLGCVDATLRRIDGTVVASTFTREDGTFEFVAPAAGRYDVAFRTLGMAEAVAPLDSLHPASEVDREFSVPLVAVDSLVERVDAAQRDVRFARRAGLIGAPRYPVGEREGGREGGVVAAIVVTPEGRVDEAMTSILYASAEPFEGSVREAFGRMRFEPAQFDGQARCSLVILPYIFEFSASDAPRSNSFVVGEPVAAPSGAGQALPAEGRGPCPPAPVATDGTAPIYLPCQVDREAREARSNARLNWDPAGDIQSSSCFRVELRFVVGSDGVPEPGTLSLVSTNNPSFGRAFMAMVPDLRFSPARLKDGRPVRQVLTYRESVGVVTRSGNGSRAGSATPSRRTRC
jgi:hypothetical protein